MITNCVWFLIPKVWRDQHPPVPHSCAPGTECKLYPRIYWWYPRGRNKSSWYLCHCIPQRNTILFPPSEIQNGHRRLLLWRDSDWIYRRAACNGQSQSSTLLINPTIFFFSWLELTLSSVQGLCHCTDCRKLTGSLYTYSLIFKSAEIKISGNPKKITKPAESGNIVENYFCSSCGTWLTWREKEKRNMICEELQ